MESPFPEGCKQIIEVKLRIRLLPFDLTCLLPRLWNKFLPASPPDQFVQQITSDDRDLLFSLLPLTQLIFDLGSDGLSGLILRDCQELPVIVYGLLLAPGFLIGNAAP